MKEFDEFIQLNKENIKTKICDYICKYDTCPTFEGVPCDECIKHALHLISE